MNSPRYARLIAEVFRRDEPRTTDLSSRSNRDEEIALIEQAMDGRRRRTMRLRVVAGWSMAAAVIVAVAGTWRIAHEKTMPLASKTLFQASTPSTAGPPVAIAIASGSGAVVAAPGSSAPAVAGRTLQAGSRLIVDPSSGATLSLSTGTHLEVEPGSQLSVIEDSRAQVFALSAGSLRADVAKLGQDERFIVRTADAEVEVRGTSFLVDVVPSDPACGAGTTTRVAVYEGVVTVRAAGRADFVGRGERWPRGCRPSSAAEPSAHAAANRAAKIDAARSAPSHPGLASAAPAEPLAAAPSGHPHATPHGAASSTLAEENDLFAEGMLARRHGNATLAIEKMDRLLERYPTSQLAENAAAERVRLLRGLDPVRAVAAARLYLQRYPNGFARADAEAIVAGTR